MSETPEQEALRVVQYLLARKDMESLSNEELAKALLRAGPLFGRLADLIEIAAERLFPGTIENMAAEQEAKEKQMAARGAELAKS